MTDRMQRVFFMLTSTVIAIIMGAVIARCAANPSDCQDGYAKNESGDCVPDAPTTCGVEAGNPFPVVMEFRDACADAPTLPDLFFGQPGTELVQVYPDAFAGVFRFVLETCAAYDYHVQWISGGEVYDIYSHASTETTPAYSIVDLTPPDGCPVVDPGEPDALQPLWDCIEVSHGDQDPLTAMVLCCEPAAGLLDIPAIAERCAQR